MYPQKDSYRNLVKSKNNFCLDYGSKAQTHLRLLQKLEFDVTFFLKASIYAPTYPK